MLSGQAGDAAGQNFASLGDELTQQIDIFVVDCIVWLDWRYSTTKIGHRSELFNLFVDGVLIAVGAEFLQLHATRRVATVFLGGVPRYTVGTLVRISPALCTFQSNDEADAFCHDRSPRIFGQR